MTALASGSRPCQLAALARADLGADLLTDLSLTARLLFWGEILIFVMEFVMVIWFL